MQFRYCNIGRLAREDAEFHAALVRGIPPWTVDILQCGSDVRFNPNRGHSVHQHVSFVPIAEHFTRLLLGCAGDPDEGARTHRKQYLCRTFALVVGR